MNQKKSTIAAIIAAAALTGILSTAPIAVYADETETSTDQSIKQKNVGSGDAVNFNCAENLIQAGVEDQQCDFGADGGGGGIGIPPNGGGNGGGNGDAQVTICHRPPGNPQNEMTQTVGAAAVPAHLAHGDSLGAC